MNQHVDISLSNLMRNRSDWSRTIFIDEFSVETSIQRSESKEDESNTGLVDLVKTV